VSSPPPVAEIHDLGYTRYTGPRLPASRRYRVIAKNVFAVAWRSRWGVKLPLIAALATTVAAAVVMFVLRGQLAEMVRMRGAALPKAEQIIFISIQFLELSAFVLALAVGCRTIADDLRLGAFQFYFARALRPRDYVAGKLLGLSLLIGLPMFAAPVILAILRLVFADDARQALALAHVVPRAIVFGLAGTAAYVLPVAGISAWSKRRQPAQALFAVYYILINLPASGLAQALELPWLRLISITSVVSILGSAIFGVPPGRHDPPAWSAAAALATICALGFALVWQRVRRAETAGLGGS
jgi:ABC-2 type transport system permease protein